MTSKPSINCLTILVVIVGVILNISDFVYSKGVINKGGGRSNKQNKQNSNFGGVGGFNIFGEGGGSYDEHALEFLKSGESKLRAYLLSNYSYDVRPVINTSTVTWVNITLTIIQIMDIDEQNQVMITNAQIALKWFDEHLVWDPEDFDNQTRLVLSSKDVWTPDIVLFNSADVAYSTQRDNYLIDVRSDGAVTWMFPDILRSYCRVDIKYFPFDQQSCTLELQSWARNKHEVYVYHDENPFMNHSFINTEWRLLDIKVQPGEQNDFVWLEFTLFLKRNHAFYVNHIIFPFIIVSSLSLFVFWLPPDSGEKITLTITILLALIVFLQFITEYTPKAAKTLPIIGLYFNINLILVLVSVLLTILVLNFHFRGPKKQRVPRWMRKYIIGYLGKAFCFCYESRAYQKAQEENQDIIESVSNTQYINANDSKNKENKKQFSNFETGHISVSVKAPVSNRSNKNCTIDATCNQIQQIHGTVASEDSDDEFEGQQEPAYIKNSNSLKNIKIYRKQNQNSSDYRNENVQFLSRSHDALSPLSIKRAELASTDRTENTASSRDTSAKKRSLKIHLAQQTPFNEDISKNLERMLNKMQKSFDPFKLRDENLKFSIIKEILECQRLLLTVNLSNNNIKSSSKKSNNKNKAMTLNEIYDEWKILAMIVDRICFFFYLLALIFSSSLFILRELYSDNFNINRPAQ